MRTYGTAKIKGGEWHLDVEPQVAVRLKRVFRQIAQGRKGTLRLKVTESVCRDLLWFFERYPVEIAPLPRAVLHKQAEAFDLRGERTLRILNGDFDAAPVEMALPPRPYQAAAVELCANNKGLLVGDVVGLGKTVTGLALAAREDARPAVFVAQAHLAHPSGAKGETMCQWEKEARRFLPSLHVHTLASTTPYDLPLDEEGREPEILICSYHKLWGWRDYLAGRIKTIVFDEVQELRTGRALKCSAAQHVAYQAQYRMGLSATMIHNYGAEFFNLVDVIAPGVLGTHGEFLREWCVDQGRHQILENAEAFGSYLRELGIFVRRTRKDVGREIPIPQQIVQTVEAEDGEMRKVQSAAVALARKIVGGGMTGWDTMRTSQELSSRLRQATGVSKARAVAQFVRMLVEEHGEPVLLFGWHREVYSIWLDELEDLSPLLYTGSETPKQKTANKDAFIRGDCSVLIMSLRSGAGTEGIQEVCRTVVIGELDWSPAVHTQCIGRAGRERQQSTDERPVFAYFLVCDSGSDPTMVDVLGLKREQLRGVEDPDKSEPDIPKEVNPDHVKRLAESYLERVTG